VEVQESTRAVDEPVGVSPFMARVSLIALIPDRIGTATDRLASFHARLEQAGHSVRVDELVTDSGPADRPTGLVKRVIDQLESTTGDDLVVVDLAMGYGPDDVLAVVERLGAGKLNLVVAARRGRWLGSVVRRVTGTADLASGLVGLTGVAARNAAGSFDPVGSRFVCELLARVDGPHGEVEVGPIAGPWRPWSPLDDIRHAKRIADDHLGNLSRLLQFCFVGASGMVVDLSTYAALQAILSQTWLARRMAFRLGHGGSPTSLAVVVAAILAIATAMTWNFSLNRRLTFNDARRGSILRQYLRYALSNLLGIGVSLVFRLLLPGSVPFFARHRLAAAVAGIVAATGISFSLARWFVFRTRSQPVVANLEAVPEGSRRDPSHCDGVLAARHPTVNPLSVASLPKIPCAAEPACLE